MLCGCYPSPQHREYSLGVGPLVADCTHSAYGPKAVLRQEREQSDSDQQRRSLTWNPINAGNPGTKANWSARNRRSNPRTSGPSVFTSKTGAEFEIWRCSILQLTASYAAVIWSTCACATLCWIRDSSGRTAARATREATRTRPRRRSPMVLAFLEERDDIHAQLGAFAQRWPIQRRGATPRLVDA